MTCQQTNEAVVHLFTKAGYDCTNFLDDFGGAEVDKKAWQAFYCLGKSWKDLRLTTNQTACNQKAR